MTLINVSSSYHNLKLDFKKSSYLATFIFQFCRYRFIWLPFRVVLVGDMFKQKLMRYSKAYQSYLSIADGILTM